MRHEKLETKSGAPLYFIPLSYVESITAGVLIKVGTRDEIWPEEAGLAHALEHMVFRGARSFPNSKDLTGYIEEVGGRLNAWTDIESTAHYRFLPAEYLERAVYSLSEVLLWPTFPHKTIKIEMDAIVEEIRRRNDNPRLSVFKNFAEEILKHHPLAKDGLGLEESVLNFKRKDFVKFKEKFVHPANFVYIIIGKAAKRECLALFDKFFTEQKSKPANINAPEAIPPQRESKNTMEKEIEQAHISLGAAIQIQNFRLPFVLDMFGNMIGGGMSSPLFQNVRDALGLCYEISAHSQRYKDASLFEIYIGANPKKYPLAIDAIIKVIKENKNNAVLLEKTKTMAKGRISLSSSSPMALFDMACESILYEDRIVTPDELKSEIDSVTIEEIENAVDEYLAPEKLTTCVLLPKK